MNAYQWNMPRARPNNPADIFEIDATSILALQVERLTKQVAEMSASATPPWANNVLIEKQVDYMGNLPRASYNPNSALHDNTYNVGNRNHLISHGATKEMLSGL